MFECIGKLAAVCVVFMTVGIVVLGVSLLAEQAISFKPAHFELSKKM